MHEDLNIHQIDLEGERDEVQDNRVQEVNCLINETDSEQELRTVLRVEDEEKENTFN